MKLVIASDHAGFALKEEVRAKLAAEGHEVVDLGAYKCEPEDDYPDFAEKVGEAMKGGVAPRGIVICGSGVGVCVAANKIPGIRAALAWTAETARLARQHNDANVLSLGAREYSITDAIGFAKIFVETPFSQEPRHARRLAMIADYEKSGELPPLPGPA